MNIKEKLILNEWIRQEFKFCNRMLAEIEVHKEQLEEIKMKNFVLTNKNFKRQKGLDFVQKVRLLLKLWGLLALLFEKPLLFQIHDKWRLSDKCCGQCKYKGFR